MALPKVTVELTEKELSLLSRQDLRMYGSLRDKLYDAHKRLIPIKREYNRENKRKRLERKAGLGKEPR